MAKKPLPSPEVLRQLLRYEPDTGKLFWKERTEDMFQGWGRGKTERTPEWRRDRWNSVYAGVEAGSEDVSSGYVRVYIGDKHFYAHRVIWVMNRGIIPSGMQIDHINGIRSDNLLANLRLVTVEINAQNMRLRENSSGHTGVFWNNQNQKWCAKIHVNGKSIHLGFFDDVANAAAARKKAERRHGFHSNHGASSKPVYRVRLRRD